MENVLLTRKGFLLVARLEDPSTFPNMRKYLAVLLITRALGSRASTPNLVPSLDDCSRDHSLH